jgi:hypothetical protein
VQFLEKIPFLGWYESTIPTSHPAPQRPANFLPEHSTVKGIKEPEKHVMSRYNARVGFQQEPDPFVTL